MCTKLFSLKQFHWPKSVGRPSGKLVKPKCEGTATRGGFCFRLPC